MEIVTQNWGGQMVIKREYILVMASILCFIVGVIVGYLVIPKSTTQQASIIVVDDLGRTVTLSSPPKRIISVASAATRTLYDLGVLDRVVGVDKYSDDPPEAQNKTIVDPKNSEGILSLNPDLIIAWWYQQSYLAPIEEVDIPVIYIHPQTIDGIMNDIMLIGTAVGVPDKARQLVADLRVKLGYIEDLVDNLTETYGRPYVYVELYKPYKTIGRDTFTHNMVELAGGINIAGNLTGYPTLSDEYIIQADPDIILYESDSLTYDDFASRPGWENITAIKEHRVYYLDRHIATASPRFIEGLVFMVEKFFNVTVDLSSIGVPMKLSTQNGNNYTANVILSQRIFFGVPIYCEKQ